MEETGVDEDGIDELFGWKQKEREKVQQLHYLLVNVLVVLASR